MIESAGYKRPFIERYSKQYVDFPSNTTIFTSITDNPYPHTKIFIELTKNSELYVSMAPDILWRHTTERNLPVIADVCFKGHILADAAKKRYDYRGGLLQMV